MSTTTTVQAPPQFQQPFIERGFRESTRLLERGGPGVYQDAFIAPESQFMSSARTNTLGDTGDVRQFNKQFRDFLGASAGQSLDPNDHAAFNALTGSIQNQAQETLGFGLNSLQGSATASGAFGGSRQQVLENQAVSDTARGVANANANLGGQFFSQLLQSRDRAMAMAPGAAQASMIPGQAEIAIGTQQQNRSQSIRDAQRERFDLEQSRPEIALDNYMTRVLGRNVGQSSSVNSPSRSTAGNAIAGGFGGAAIGYELGQGPGALIGGTLGAIGGLFS